MHWSNSPHLIPVIEVVKGDQTAKATVDTTVALVESLNLIVADADLVVSGTPGNGTAEQSANAQSLLGIGSRGSSWWTRRGNVAPALLVLMDS